MRDMQDENSVSQITTNTCKMNNDDDFSNGDELGKLVGDSSFSDVTSDDSSGWMHKIDVTNFQRLTSNSSIDGFPKDTIPNSVRLVDNTSVNETKPDSKLVIGQCDTAVFSYDHSEMTVLPSNRLPIQRSSRNYDSNQHLVASLKSSPPTKKQRQRDLSAGRQIKKSTNHEPVDQQISVVSSSSDTSRYDPNRQYPKPVYSYSCMIALALKNSQTGRLQVAEIYCFMCENYPYFRTAPAGWKNSVRHNLSLNKCFEKIEVEAPGGHGRKCCLWTVNPLKAAKMDQEIRKYREKDPIGVKEAYSRPEDVDLVEQGLKGMPSKSYQSSAFGRTMLPDVQSAHYLSRVHHEPKLLHGVTVDTKTDMRSIVQSNTGQGYVGVGKSELAMKLLRQAAGYSQGNLRLHVQPTHTTCETASAETASWLPPQWENNRNALTPATDHCPLEFSPVRHDNDMHVFSSQPTYSTPIRRSSTAACYSPFSQSEHQHRPASLQQFQYHEIAQPMAWFQSSSPLHLDPHSLPIFGSAHHRTPERPSSHGYFFGDALIGGGNTSLLVTPTNESHHQRILGTRASLEAAFGASTPQDNSLLLQSMQQHLIPQSDQQQSDAYSLAFQTCQNGHSDGPLHLTCL